jgi:hypothetical protein
MKGEAKQLCYFKPIDTRASANSRTHSHVLNSHPGFDSSYTYGAMTLLFQHILTNDEKTNEDSEDANNKNELIKDAVHQIVDSLMEENVKTCEASVDETSQPTDDKYSHKFINTTYNESVFCGYCNKKVILAPKFIFPVTIFMYFLYIFMSSFLDLVQKCLSLCVL